MVAPTVTETVYTHATEPRPAKSQRLGGSQKAPAKAKYRAPEENPALYPNNIMFDRRIVRGSTYSAQVVPAEMSSAQNASTTLRAGSTMASTRKRPAASLVAPRATTPDPVEGRRHMDVQTDQYLEELTDIVPEIDVTTQTEAFIDRPPTPLFVPKKSGLDATTQIEPGDLFDFDFEVEPLLEVLVGKVLEQGLMEVMEEEELKAMRAHQEHFEQIRNAELIATQRMEEAERRKLSEKERRVAQEKERIERERELREKVAACAFARGYLNGLLGNVFQEMVQSGHFYDPVERQVADEFMPWLRDATRRLVDGERNARSVAARLVQQAVDEMARRKAAAEAERAAAEAKAAEEAALVKAEAEARNERVRAYLATKATWALSESEPRLVNEEAAAAARAELEATAAKEAERAWKKLRKAAADEARASFPPLESKPAAPAETEGEAEAEAEVDEEAALAAAEAAAAEHAEALAKAVAEAMDAVVKPEATPVTESDVVLRAQAMATDEARAAMVTALCAAFPDEMKDVLDPPPPPPPAAEDEPVTDEAAASEAAPPAPVAP